MSLITAPPTPEPRIPPPQTYTPSHLTDKILATRPALAGERKQVTVLFADLKDSTELIRGLDPEAAQQLLDPAIHHMMDAVHRFEGTVNQVLGDGIMALFGAPIAHEDHALRACYAALAMQAAMRAYTDDVRRTRGLELRMRVGLNAGEVVVRAIGNDLHMDYSAVGETTVLAARMEQTATPGTIRLSAATLRLVDGLVQVTALGPVPVKGLAEPVEVFELVGASQLRRRLQAAAARGLTPFVGRQPELAALHHGLAHLQAAEFLYETRLFPEPEHTFKHALTHEVVYSSLLLERRRVLHARLVAAIEALAPERGTEDASGAQGRAAGKQGTDQVERLAYHALRGEVWDKAVLYCQQAGARAWDRAAFREAVASFEQALQALAHLPERGDTRVLAIEIRLTLGNALTQLGEHRQRLALLGEAEALARALDDRARLGWVLASMALALRIMGDPRGAMAASRPALELAVALGDRALQAEASLNLGRAYEASGDFDRAAELLRQNVAATHQQSETPHTNVRLLSQSQALLVRSLGALGIFAEGRRHAEEALRLATREGRGATPIVVHAFVSRLYLAQGDLEHAIRVCTQGLTLSRASGNRNMLPQIVAGLGYAAALQGRHAEGRALLEEAVRESSSTGARRAVFWAWLSEGCRLEGHGAEALQHAHQALDLARQQKDRGDEALALHQLGVVHAHADPSDVVQAEAYYQRALALADELGMRPLRAHCHSGLGMLYTKTGQQEQARAELSTAMEMYRTMEMTFWLPQVEAALAQME